MEITLTGWIFGLTDNGTLLIFAMLGFDLDKHLGGSGRTGMLVGSLLGNTVSDAFGALVDPALNGMILGITVGCLIPLALLPLCEKIRDAVIRRSI